MCSLRKQDTGFSISKIQCSSQLTLEQQLFWLLGPKNMTARKGLPGIFSVGCETEGAMTLNLLPATSDLRLRRARKACGTL